MGKSDSLEHLLDVNRHQGGAEWMGQVPEDLDHLGPQEADLEQFFPVNLKIYIFSYLFYIISDIMSQIGIFEMI